MREQNGNAARHVLPFYAVRLENLIAPKAVLIVRCGFCSHESELDVIALACRHGPTTQLRALERKLRCRQCLMGGCGTFLLNWPGA